MINFLNEAIRPDKNKMFYSVLFLLIFLGLFKHEINLRKHTQQKKSLPARPTGVDNFRN